MKGEDSELIHLLAPVTMPSTNSKPIINKSGSTGSLNSRLGNGGMQGQLLDDESPRNGLKVCEMILVLLGDDMGMTFISIW